MTTPSRASASSLRLLSYIARSPPILLTAVLAGGGRCGIRVRTGPVAVRPARALGSIRETASMFPDLPRAQDGPTSVSAAMARCHNQSVRLAFIFWTSNPPIWGMKLKAYPKEPSWRRRSGNLAGSASSPTELLGLKLRTVVPTFGWEGFMKAKFLVGSRKRSPSGTPAAITGCAEW
jgi:hypothetical protein